STYNFQPMPQSQRWLIHQLSTYYLLRCEAFDRDPRRFVRVCFCFFGFGFGFFFFLVFFIYLFYFILFS
ncbi:hypothetical protein NL529_32710, partial [Klebsiella pneumoniae]|nr:hypothetical protein [Klebsiella pneumoniae]